MRLLEALPIVCMLLTACSAQQGSLPTQIETSAERIPTEELTAAANEPEATDEAPAGVVHSSELSRADVELPENVINPVLDWRPPPYQSPLAILPTDHFYFTRPIPSGDVNWPNPRYRYGSTAFGEESIHTGVDLVADRDTPVIAAGEGEVVWVGYGLYGGLEDPTDPYGLAVAIRHDFGHEGQQLYTAYAHLESVDVWLGQRVKAGDIVGKVGDTGHASAPHLHFEVRTDENRYFASRNPELWMVPAEGWGVLAGRVQDTWSRPLTEYLVQINAIDSGQIWDVWTYALGTVQPDDYYQENFVISDLPEGAYQVKIDFAGRSYTTYLYLKPGQTNFLEFNGRRGFTMEDEVLPPARSAFPPYP